MSQASNEPLLINGFLARPLVLVEDWQSFYEWAVDAGYGEAELNWRDSRCTALQEQYLQELADKQGREGIGPDH